VPFRATEHVASFDAVVSPFELVPVIFQKYGAAANVPPPTFGDAARVPGAAREVAAVKALVA